MSQSTCETAPTTHRRVRVTVPLFDCSLLDGGRFIGGRHNITTDLVLASLTSEEAHRVQAALGERTPPWWRLELHNFEVVEHLRDRWFEDPSVLASVRQLMALLSLVVRVAPRWPTIVLDENVDGKWRRFAWVAGNSESPSSRGSWRQSHLPVERLVTWGKLASEWPKANDRLDLALGFYYDSIVDARDGDLRRALLLAGVALEVLLAGEGESELSYRIAQRGALLTSRGPLAHSVFRLLRNCYSARSKLVHAGTAPNKETVTRLHQFLMRALPSMAALTRATGSFKSAIGVLDDCPWERSSKLDVLLSTPDAWWAFVDLSAVVPSPGLQVKEA